MSRLLPLLLLPLLLLLGCGPAPTATDTPLRVTRGDIAPRVLLTGELDAVQAEALVTPQTPVWSLSIQWMEEDGTAVKAGDPVVEFDASALDSQLSGYLTERTQARSSLDRQHAENSVALADAEFELSRQQILVEKAEVRAAVPKENLGRRDWQERQLALAQAKAALTAAVDGLATREKAASLEIEVLEIELATLERQIEAADDAIEDLTLRAPKDGLLIIGNHPWMGRKYDLGDESWPGSTVVRLPDLSVMQVKATLPDVDDGRLEVGMAATCVLDAWPERSWAGTVTDVGAVAGKPSRDSLRRHFGVTITLDETDPDVMLPGMSVRAEIVTDRATDVLIAPRAALDLATDPPRARRASGWTDVTLGLCDAHACEVIDGLAADDVLRAR